MARYNNVRAVVLGLELNGLNVVRSLGRDRVMVVGVDTDLEQASALSKYLLSRLKTPDIRGAEVIETIKRLASDGQEYALFPTMDATVLAISEERERLPKNVRFRLPDRQTVRRLMHKGSFRDLCKTLNLPTPGYALVDGRARFEGAIGELRMPVVMKTTLKKMDVPKACLMEYEQEALDLYCKHGEGEVILEEWIPGGDGNVVFCLQAYDDKSELLASFTGRKIRQWPPLIGGTASAEPVEIRRVEEVTTAFFKQVGYKGIGSMEFKYDERNDTYYAIEPTVGRTDFQSGIAPANGVNIPLIAFGDMAGAEVRGGRRRGAVKWVHPLGDTLSARYYMERGELTTREWKRSLAGPRVSTLFAIDDPGPWVSDVFRRLVGRMRRMFRREGAAP